MNKRELPTIKEIILNNRKERYNQIEERKKRIQEYRMKVSILKIERGLDETR